MFDTSIPRLAVIALTFSTAAALAQGPIYTFRNKSNGIFPLGPVTADAAGNLYGATFNGGLAPNPHNECGQDENGCGVVYRLSPNGSGGWTYSVLYKFKGAPTDAEDSEGPIAIDAHGNIFGSTYYGGNTGVVFELSPTGNGTYTEQAIYSFNGNASGSQDGSLPTGVALDAAGSVYGTTTNGGAHNQSGTVWKLSPKAGGGWTEQVIWSFGGAGDGQYPRGPLLIDAAGHLFGTTSNGGTYNEGTLFELSPAAGGAYTESFLYSFGTSGLGCGPSDWLTSDAAGSLYGTTNGCTAFGTVFKFSPSSGSYSMSIIHYFLNSSPGSIPGPVVLDSAGNIYGTTSQGGQYNWGTVYKLTPNGTGDYAESPIHNFTGNADGAQPYYGVILGANGMLYGTTPYGGSAANFSGFGVVFEYKP